MSNVDWQKVEKIIDQVLELPVDKRAKFVDAKCGNDIQLKSEVTLLLESISDSEGWLEDPGDYKKEFYEEISDDVELLSADRSLLGKEVGSYTIKEKIGEGGMGTVYLAERSDADFEHRVAIKILRQGRATKANIRRFRREQRILAGLNHPGIARLYDGGVTDDGFPYIIMEYVDGTPVDEYCRVENCTLDDKIMLFEYVLEAVRYAHENLVIHRDLKPGNILVDKEGSIKILDFGISKLIEDEDDAALTQTGARLLTPRYAAPEQIKQQNITTATDLYALGIVFYQLLTDTGPYHLEGLSAYEIEQTILKQEPVKPSGVVDNAKLKKKLSGDIDAIALKALRKEPDRRYRVANEFLDDLKNYVTGIPVSARQDSFRYRSQKFFKRHKKSVAITAGVLLLIIGLVGFYTWQIAQERNMAQKEAQRAKEIKEFTFEIFGSIDPKYSQTIPKDITATQLLKSGLKTIDQELRNQPDIYVELMNSMGNSLQSFDEYKSSISALKKALEKSRTIPDNNLQTANILMSLANVYNTLENTAEAKELILESINIIQSDDPGGFQQLAHSYSKLGFSFAIEGNYTAAKSNYLKADSLYIKSKLKEKISRYDNLRSFAEVQIRLEDYDNAENNILEVLSFYKSYYDTLNPGITEIHSQIGNFYSVVGQYDKANKYLINAIETNPKIWGEENSNSAQIYGNLALNYREMRDLDKALTAIQKNVALTKKISGENSYRYAIAINNLALIQNTRNEFQKAKANYRKAVQIKEKLLPSNHPSLAIGYYNYGDYLSDQKEYHEAITYFEKAIAIDKEALGTNSVGVAVDNNRLASTLIKVKEFSRADSLFSNAKNILQEKLPKNHKRIAENLVEQGKLFIALNQFESAKQNFEQASTAYKANFDSLDSRIVEADSLLQICNRELN